MERKMMETTKRQSYWWWFGNHNTSPGRSQWLQSTLSELDEKTKAMLTIIEEDADSFALRAEMFYKKRPQLITMVEDFYRAHRSLAEELDHLRHDPCTRRTSPLARSFSLSTTNIEKAIDPRKSYDSCFAKLAYGSEDLPSSPLSKGSSEKSMDLVYDSEESLDSEVDDPLSEVNYGALNLGGELDLMSEIERLREENMTQRKELMEKDEKMKELSRKLGESLNEVMELKEEAEKLRLENVEMYVLKVKDSEEKEELAADNAAMEKVILQKDEEKRELMKQLEEKDEEKREAIRQMSFAIEMLKGEKLQLKKSLVMESSKKRKPFEFQMLKGFGKMFNR